MIKISRNKLGNFLLVCPIFLMGTGRIFSGWPPTWVVQQSVDGTIQAVQEKFSTSILLTVFRQIFYYDIIRI
jgi:hypothetical protein